MTEREGMVNETVRTREKRGTERRREERGYGKDVVVDIHEEQNSS